MFLISIRLQAQEIDPLYSFDDIIETIMDGLDEETDFSSVLEDLENFYRNPLPINSATDEDLRKLHLLNDFQINQILTYRKKTGSVFTIYELNSLEGFDRALLEKLIPFISFEIPSEENRNLKPDFIRQNLLVRSNRVLQKQEGYKEDEESNSAYAGSQEKIYSRYRFELGEKIEAGFTAEKDPGEAFFGGSNKTGFDYYSGHISLNLNSVLKNITVGDFWIQSGQGLVLWQGFAQRKSDDPMQIIKSGNGFRPYSSTDENRFFRGIGTKFEFNNLEIQVFTSMKKRDANLEFSEDATYFTSLQTSGYHRTENEIEDERSINETSSGFLLSFRKNRLKLGATFLYQKFNYPLIRDEQPYNRFRLSGDVNLNAGIDYYFVTGKYQFFGEAAISKSGGTAILQGLQAHIHNQAELSFLFRHFNKNYHSLTGNAFAENSDMANETGFYAGLKLLPVKKIRVLTYSDYFRFPWITYTTMAPSNGFDFAARIDYIFSPGLQFYIRYKKEKKEVKITEGNSYVNSDLVSDKIRVNMDYRLSENWKFKSRLEFSSYKKYEKENGFMVFQDVNYTAVKIPFRAQLRLAYTNTESFNTRIYAYENDLLYNYSLPAYYSENVRVYLNMNYEINKKWEWWFKVSNTHYLSENTIGSGYNEITGKNITEVKIQTRLKF